MGMMSNFFTCTMMDHDKVVGVQFEGGDVETTLNNDIFRDEVTLQFKIIIEL